MIYLMLVTLLWAFSFSLIGVFLAGTVDPWFCVFMRIGVAALLFVPFMWLKPRQKKISTHTKLALMSIGAIQLGVMYFFFYHAFNYLPVHKLILFTIFTPFYVTLINSFMTQKWHLGGLLSAALAVLGAYIIRYTDVTSDFLVGFLIVQASNISFAFGQVAYKHLMHKQNSAHKHASDFGWFYLGALIPATLAWSIFGDASKLPQTQVQWSVLTYLGLIASGLGYFLWNKGASLVNAGQLSIMNNALVPAGIFVNLSIWQKDVALEKLILGTSVILFALLINHYWVTVRTNVNPNQKSPLSKAS